jgi:hypothetical protein
MTFAILHLIEITPILILAFIWWDEREAWMFIPITILIALVIGSG